MIEFPYQLVLFLDREPQIGEPVYYGPNGWFANVTIRRRFKLIPDVSEEDFIEKLSQLYSIEPSRVVTTEEFEPARALPVAVVEADKNVELMSLYSSTEQLLDAVSVSKHPEREGDVAYYPHVTVEYNGSPVLEVQRYVNQQFPVSRVWLLKDIADQNSIAYRSFDLVKNT